MFDIRFKDVSPAFLAWGEVTLEHYRQSHMDKVVNSMLEMLDEQGNRTSSAHAEGSRGVCV